ncbi:TetR family transcriptional regulator [Staphylococcus pettenkoferi]|uniref:TetR/AcrR family transcriptional regulator n=1 Tax=Staphylococcus pettenkoferi TaxID=170573 RepID=UPI001C8BADE3|nr:TetR/AcrR family transcriptional regulator C-terminal domain-containing protein [Staphylococcus pettenkoferi]MBX8994404.1 TetR family transcriptional regulator [Staphylococcus pettenkoferi]
MTEDRRIRKTKEAIKYALIDLLKHKTLEKITIKDITESADINRGTFYLHYLDKYDLLEQIEDEYIERLSQSLDYDLFLTPHIDAETFAREFATKILRNILYYIGDNLEFYRVVLNIGHTTRIEEKIRETMFKNMEKHITQQDMISAVPKSYFHSYVAGATISFIKHWVRDDNPPSADLVVDYLFKIVYNGPLRLMASEHSDYRNK